MDLIDYHSKLVKINVEEIHFPSGRYLAVVRAESKYMGEAVFRVKLSRRLRRSRKTERTIDDLKTDAESTLASFCRDIIKTVEARRKKVKG